MKDLRLSEFSRDGVGRSSGSKVGLDLTLEGVLMNDEVRKSRVKRIRERTESLYRAGFYSADEGKRMMEWTKSELMVELEFILSHAESLVLADRTVVAR